MNGEDLVIYERDEWTSLKRFGTLRYHARAEGLDWIVESFLGIRMDGD